MFTKSILFLASKEQAERWLPLVDNLNMLGCYCQTEMGHGSNVQGMETTATLDLATDEFVLHTPNIRATKLWAGGLGLFATHAIVFAKMISGENNYGVNAFMVPIRSRVDHSVFTGVQVGEMGAKMGYNTVDNGWMKFDNYRIPRTALLSRFANIDKEGAFEMVGDPRSVY